MCRAISCHTCHVCSRSLRACERAARQEWVQDCLALLRAFEEGCPASFVECDYRTTLSVFLGIVGEDGLGVNGGEFAMRQREAALAW